MTKTTRLMAAVGAAVTAAAITGVAVLPAANASTIGKIAVKVHYSALTISRNTAQQLTADKAYQLCKTEYPRTKFVTLEFYRLAATNEGPQLQTNWGCLDTP